MILYRGFNVKTNVYKKRNSFFCCFYIISVTAQEIEEVVVTATKKEESLQDVAISIDAVTGEDILMNKFMMYG